MKKFLSLVLALVMTMSLVTISAGAKDFTDKSSIKYNEAVDVMSGIGIIDGYTDGSFNPTGTLTRGAAAKIICCMVLGKTAAESLGVASAPFSDVPTTNVFSGYIAYCAENGYINGYADGTFKPAGTLTGYAFLKMLECALGYDSTIEEFTGTNWTVKVATIAIKKSLTKGNDAFVGTKAATREEACLYAFNTLKANTVGYSNKGTNITVNGTTINTGASDAADAQGSGVFRTVYQANLGYSATPDSLGRPASTWTWKATKIGTYPQKAAVTFTASTKETAVKSALSSYTLPAGMDLTVNDTTSADAADTTAEIAAATGNGTVVEIYADSTNTITAVVKITPKLAQITAINTTTKTVTVSGYAKVTNDDNAALYAQLAAMSVEDYIVVSYQDLATDVIVEAYKPTTVSGTASALNSAKVTLGGTTYTSTATYYAATGSDLSTVIDHLGDTDYTLYLDQYGYVVGAEETSNANSTYAYAIGYSKEGTAMAGFTYNVKLVMADGTTKWVAMSQYAGNVLTKDSAVATMTGTVLDEVTSSAGAIVSYKALSDGTYNLTVSQNAEPSANKWDTLKKNNTAVYNNDGTTASTLSANNSTVFLFKNTDGTYTAYTGIKNLPATTISGATIFANVASGTAKLIVVTSGSKSSSSANIMYVIAGAGSAYVNGSEYYAYNALVNGTEKTVYCADGSSYVAGSFYSGAAYSDAEYNILTAYGAAAGSLIDADVIGAGATPNYYSYDSTVDTLTLKNGLLTVDSATFSVSDDFKVYFVDTSLTPDAVADLALTSTTITASGAKVLVSVDGTANGLATAVYVIGAIS